MISEDFQILVSTPPESIEHDTRQREIMQLSDYLAVQHSRDDGTDYLVTDANYIDASGNAGRVYIARDANTNAIEGIYSKVGGTWTRWLIQTKDLDPTAMDTMLRISDEAKIQLVYDTDSFDLDDADVDGKRAFKLKPLSITPALLTPAVAGKGLVQNTSTDVGYQNRIDLNSDDSSIELYDSTPDETDTADKVWKARVKEAGITQAMLASAAPPVLLVTAAPVTLDVDSSTTAQSILWNTPLVNQGTFVVSGADITPPSDSAGWYQFSIVMMLRAETGLTFTDAAFYNPVELALTGAESGVWMTLGTMVADNIVDTYTLIPMHMSGTVKLAATSALGFTFRLPVGIKLASTEAMTLSPINGANALSLSYIGAAS